LCKLNMHGIKSLVLGYLIFRKLQQEYISYISGIQYP